MDKWKDLSYEVVLNIAQELEGYYYKEEWMFVNKQLQDMYQSFEFKDIFIKLDANSDKKFAIANSILKPGLWTKDIFVDDFKAPAASDFSKLDKNVDPLYLLMQHCPSVKTSTSQKQKMKKMKQEIGSIFQQYSWIVMSGTWNQSLHFPQCQISVHQHISIALIICATLLQNSN